MELERCPDTTFASDLLLVDADGPSRLIVRGELDGISARDLIREVEAVLLLPPVPATLTLDLSGVLFMDSAGIRSLLACRRMATIAGCSLVLERPSARVTEVLAITGLLPTFGLAPA